MKDASHPLLRSASSARHLWTISIFLHLHILVTADPQLLYQQFTKLGYTLDENKPCLFDCVDGRCRAGESRELVPCRDSGELAPTFHTIRESAYEYCLSNCGKFGTNYEWCYVDSYGKWDYCSSVTENKMIIDRSFTYDGKACSNDCSYHGYHYLWCNTFDGSWGKCDPGVYSYVQAYTARGTPCWGRCEKHTTGELSKHAYNVCESSADIAEGCAPPALPIAQLNHMLSCLPETNQCPAIPRRRRRNVTPTQSELPRRSRRNVTFTECVDELTDNLVRIPIMSTTILANNPTNPIFSYTMIPAAYTGRAALPVVVRARITQATIRTGPRGDMPSAVDTNLKAMGMIKTGDNRDEAGHLIGSQLGGVETVYNVAPQTRRLNRGTGRFNDYPQWRPSVWYHRDENIRSFIDRTNGTADLTVTVRYDLTRSFRPIGFHVREILRNPDGSIAYECPDFYYSNDPDHVE